MLTRPGASVCPSLSDFVVGGWVGGSVFWVGFRCGRRVCQRLRSKHIILRLSVVEPNRTEPKTGPRTGPRTGGRRQGLFAVCSFLFPLCPFRFGCCAELLGNQPFSVGRDGKTLQNRWDRGMIERWAWLTLDNNGQWFA